MHVMAFDKFIPAEWLQIAIRAVLENTGRCKKQRLGGVEMFQKIRILLHVVAIMDHSITGSCLTVN